MKYVYNMSILRVARLCVFALGISGFLYVQADEAIGRLLCFFYSGSFVYQHFSLNRCRNVHISKPRAPLFKRLTSVELPGLNSTMFWKGSLFSAGFEYSTVLCV